MLPIELPIVRTRANLRQTGVHPCPRITHTNLKLIGNDPTNNATDELAALRRATEDRDARDVLVYQTLEASIELLESGASAGMAADMLRLARSSMTEAWELVSVSRSKAAGVSNA